MDDLAMMPSMKNRTTPVVLCNRWGSYSINVMLEKKERRKRHRQLFHVTVLLRFHPSFLEIGLSQQTIFCISYVERTDTVIQTETD